MSSSPSSNLPTIIRPCALAPRLVGGGDLFPTATIAQGEPLPWDPSARTSSDRLSIVGCLTKFASHPATASHVEWMCPQPDGSLSSGFVLQVQPTRSGADVVPLAAFAPHPGNATACSGSTAAGPLIPWTSKCTTCLDSGSSTPSTIQSASSGWTLHGCVSVTRDASTRTACSWVGISQGSTCLPAESKDPWRILSCGDDAAFVSKHLNPSNMVPVTGNGNVEGLGEQSSIVKPAASRSSGASWMVFVGAAAGGVLVLILVVVFVYRRCFRDSKPNPPKAHSPPLLPYHRPANLGKTNLTRPNPTRAHSTSSSARSSLVHVPAAPSDPLHERFDSTLSQLTVLHNARSPAAKFSSLGLLFVPLPDIDHLPSPDLYLTTSLESLIRDWDAIFHRLECECAQLIVANHREWPTGSASVSAPAAAVAAQHVNFAQYHMQRAQLMAHTMGHIWRVLVLGSAAPNALVDALVADMREVLVKVAAVFPTLEMVGTRAGSEFRADAMCGYGVSGVGRDTMVTEVASLVGGEQEAPGTVVKEMVWPGWMDVGKLEVVVKARVIV